jgi:hypothetical protein
LQRHYVYFFYIPLPKGPSRYPAKINFTIQAKYSYSFLLVKEQAKTACLFIFFNLRIVQPAAAILLRIAAKKNNRR